MKQNYMMILAAAAVCVVAACNKNELQKEEVQEGAVAVSYIRATANEDGTKGSIDGTTGAFTWNTGDQIAVWASGAYKVSDPLNAIYDSTNDATFTFGSNPFTEGGRANFAVYPASFADNAHYTNTDLAVTLPASYTLAEVRDNVTPCPMIATNVEDGNLSFKQLCALLRLTVNNIPPSTKRLELDFGAGKNVSGSFTVSLSPGDEVVVPATSTISNDGGDGHVITITKDGSNVTLNNDTWLDGLVLNIPIPVGTYTTVTVTAYDALSDGTVLLTMTRPIKVSENWEPERHSARKCVASLPAFSISATQRVCIAPANLKTTDNMSTFAFHTNAYDNIYGASTSDTDWNVNNRDLFQWNEVTGGTSGSSINFGTINGKNDWRLLTDSEFCYIFSRSGQVVTRAKLTTANGFPDTVFADNSNDGERFSPNQMNSGTAVAIILPDHWDPELTTTTMAINMNKFTGASGFPAASEITADVYQQLIAAGAIFLPATLVGRHVSEGVVHFVYQGINAFYLLSTEYPYDTDYMYAINITIANINRGSVTSFYRPKSRFANVRLVRVI